MMKSLDNLNKTNAIDERIFTVTKSIPMNRTYCYKCVIVLASIMGALSVIS